MFSTLLLSGHFATASGTCWYRTSGRIMWGLSFEQSAPGIWMKNWEDIESIDPCDGGPVQTLILPSFMILKDQSCVIFSMIYGDCCQMCNTLTPVTSISPNTTSTAVSLLVTSSWPVPEPATTMIIFQFCQNLWHFVPHSNYNLAPSSGPIRCPWF